MFKLKNVFVVAGIFDVIGSATLRAALDIATLLVGFSFEIYDIAHVDNPLGVPMNPFRPFLAAGIQS
jgi:hypothetical protein